MLHEALHAELAADSGVAALVATRIYPMLIPQKSFEDATRHGCVVFTRVGVGRLVRLCNGGTTDGLVQSTVQIDSYAKRLTTTDGALAIAAAVRAALVDFRGELGGSGGELVKSITLDDEAELMDPEPGLYRISQRYTIWHVEQ